MLQVALVVKSSPAKAGDIRDSVESLRWEDPLEKEMATHSCLESPMDRGAWRATVHKVAERWILNWAGLKRFSTHMHTQSEKTVAAHSSALAWKIPWTEEPGGLQPMGSLRVGHDWATSLSLFTSMHWRRQWQPTALFLPGESQGRGSLVGCHLWGRTESDTTEAT